MTPTRIALSHTALAMALNGALAGMRRALAELETGDDDAVNNAAYALKVQINAALDAQQLAETLTPGASSMREAS
ncbi:MAG: hypothetical protein H0T60_10350 [Acidobacteria bacterium]|nr:hypothetical protein [Acidobacteriota bacterium]